MMRKLKKLPIGIQSFETIREQDYLYVDKTSDIFRLVDEGMFYFLSRPRRFGKSLLISTLKCLFQGKRELFDGLWIEQQTDWGWKKYSVVVIDFNGISFDTPEILQTSLRNHLKTIANNHEIGLQTTLLKDSFKELLLTLSQKTGQPCSVILMKNLVVSFRNTSNNLPQLTQALKKKS